MQHNDSIEITNTITTALGDPGGVFMAMNFITKGCVTIAVASGIVTLVLAILRSAKGGQRSQALAVLGNIGLAAGVLGAAYSAFVTWQVSQMLHETRLAVLMPSIIEIVMALLAGVIVWLIARFGNAGAKA